MTNSAPFRVVGVTKLLFVNLPGMSLKNMYDMYTRVLGVGKIKIYSPVGVFATLHFKRGAEPYPNVCISRHKMEVTLHGVCFRVTLFKFY